MPAALGTNARNLKSIAAWALAAMVAAAPLTLWWQSVEGWSVLAAAIGLLWLCWLCWRTTDGRTDTPGHPLHAALLAIGLLAGWNLLRTGVKSPGHSLLLGQVDASLLTQISLLALLVMMVQDLLTTRRLGVTIPTVYGLIVLAGGLIGLAASTRDEGRLMLSLSGWTGLAIFCWPLWRRYAGPISIIRSDPGGNTPLRWWRPGVAFVGATGLSVLCPPAVPVVTGAIAVTLLAGAACLGGPSKALAAAGAVAALSAGTHAAALGWLTRPQWPSSWGDWIGRGGEALVDLSPWGGNLPLLTGFVGWAGAGAFILILAVYLIRTLAAARQASPHVQAKVMLSVLVAVLATSTWLAPGGMFNPAANVMLAVVWAFWPMAMGRRTRRRSGWLALAVIVAISMALGLVRKAGLLTWASMAYRQDDRILHLIIGWMVTQVLLWLLGRRRYGAFIALGASLAAAAGGELAQRELSERAAQMGDFIAHAKGAVCALAMYVLCKASLWSESPDVVDTPRPIANDAD